ncbi:MAG: tRNA (guanosine(37)-N1)-methyltransferase TrmD [Dehalococcoidia bacterium]|nr:MAG: tRNA (guanosine(37)-N1)-methyltransferase TrmD [Dehalococcoidia bacterium]
MRIDVLTIFPQMFDVPFSFGIFKRAIDQNLVSINVHNIRDYTHDKHHTVDDYPHGGGPGMVLKPEPVFEAVAAVKAQLPDESGTAQLPIILLTPQGRLFNQQIAMELSKYRHLIMICGRYEGIDERVVEHLVTDEISIGDYVLTGGELPALVVIDTVIRLLPGVLGSEDSAQEDSHANGLLEYPQYTRPAVFRDWPVPEILLSGNHAQIARWRREQVLRRTVERRPDLIDMTKLGQEEKQLVEQFTALSKAKSSLNKEPEK